MRPSGKGWHLVGTPQAIDLRATPCTYSVVVTRGRSELQTEYPQPGRKTWGMISSQLSETLVVG
jgi:hypothetical protein